jgi:hypothetical protein
VKKGREKGSRGWLRDGDKENSSLENDREDCRVGKALKEGC